MSYPPRPQKGQCKNYVEYRDRMWVWWGEFLNAQADAMLVALPPKMRAGADPKTIIQGIFACFQKDQDANEKKNKDAKLLFASTTSVLESAMKALRAGLMPGTEQAWLVCYGTEATVIMGYQGMVELLERTGKYAAPRLGLIHEDDKWGEDPMNPQRPLWIEKNQKAHASAKYGGNTGLKGFTHAYCIVFRLDGGPPAYEVTPIAEILRFRKYVQDSWQLAPDQMAQKFPLRRLMKLLPKTPETQALLAADAMAYAKERERTIIETQAIERPREIDPLGMMPTRPAPLAIEQQMDTTMPDAGEYLEQRKAKLVPAEVISEVDHFQNLMLSKSFTPEHLDKLRGESNLPPQVGLEDQNPEAVRGYLRAMQEQMAELA